MNKTIIVYGTTIKRAFAKMEEILDGLKYSEIQQVRRSSNEFSIYLYNGDRYLARGGYESARGYKWNYAYIDIDISGEIIDNVILPAFRPPIKSFAGSLGEFKTSDYYEWF